MCELEFKFIYQLNTIFINNYNFQLIIYKF